MGSQPVRPFGLETLITRRSPRSPHRNPDGQGQDRRHDKERRQHAAQTQPEPGRAGRPAAVVGGRSVHAGISLGLIGSGHRQDQAKEWQNSSSPQRHGLWPRKSVSLLPSRPPIRGPEHGIRSNAGWPVGRRAAAAAAGRSGRRCRQPPVGQGLEVVTERRPRDPEARRPTRWRRGPARFQRRQVTRRNGWPNSSPTAARSCPPARSARPPDHVG